jgi:hypothetical protein
MQFVLSMKILQPFKQLSGENSDVLLSEWTSVLELIETTQGLEVRILFSAPRTNAYQVGATSTRAELHDNPQMRLFEKRSMVADEEIQFVVAAKFVTSFLPSHPFAVHLPQDLDF